MLSTTLISNPKLSGEIRETSFYQPLSLGQTRPILLIGHSDAQEQDVPYRVTSLKTAINWMQADPLSPLLRSMLEAYNSGCRDIWLYSIGPMSEYREDISVRNTPEVALGDKSFYEKYYEKLQSAYSLLKDYDIFQVIVPVEASFCSTNGIDFSTPLAQLCEDIFNTSSRCVMGVLGSRATQYNQNLFNEVVANPVLSNIGNKGKFIMLVMGEGVILNQQMSVTYSAPIAVQVASLLSTIPLGRSIFGIRFNGVASLSGFDLKQDQITQLAEAKINPGLRTQRGKRGQSFETWLVTDNSLAPTGSDYWSINQTRIVSDIANTLKQYGEAYIGSVATESFKQMVYDYLNYLVKLDQIQGFGLDIVFQPRQGTASITLAITPIFGIRNIYFTVETGPGS
jgi:hypothetical protein